MATYKVIQDIEAEDKLVGPLSFRQFVYGLITAFCIYLSVVCVVHHVAFLAIIFLPPGLFTGFLAFPFGKDQPTEVWALAKLRFLVKPHTRVWNQSGVKEMVTVTAPKKVEIVRTDGLNQTEIKSRLRALADTIDSRGWAIKNVNVNMYTQPTQFNTDDGGERLIDISAMPQEVPSFDVQASDDILDEQNNPIAQQMEQMISASTTAHRQQIVQQLNDPSTTPAAAPTSSSNTTTPPADYWFLHEPTVQPQSSDQATFTNAQVVYPDGSGTSTVQSAVPATSDEEALLARIKSQNTGYQTAYPHHKVIQPAGSQLPVPPTPPVANPVAAMPPVDSSAPAVPPTPMTPTPDPAILTLANNNDLNVSTIAREANKNKEAEEQSDNEVVISLH